MKRKICLVVVALTVITMLYACGNKERNEESPVDLAMVFEEESEAKYASEKSSAKYVAIDAKEYMKTQAAAQGGEDGIRPLVKTASLKFKVKDVVKSSHTLESMTLKNGGFILKSNINSDESYVRRVQVSSDSSVLISNYDIRGYLNVRVPQEYLYQFLEEVAAEAVHVDYRLLDAEDLTIDLFTNGLAAKRMERKTKRIGTAIASRAGKLSDAVDAEEALDLAEKKADEVKVAEFVMQDKLEFSTITIEIYQNELTTREVVKNADDESAYEPSLGYQLKEALISGWHVLQELVVSLISIWPIGVIVVIFIFLLRRWRAKRNKG